MCFIFHIILVTSKAGVQGVLHPSWNVGLTFTPLISVGWVTIQESGNNILLGIFFSTYPSYWLTTLICVFRIQGLRNKWYLLYKIKHQWGPLQSCVCISIPSAEAHFSNNYWPSQYFVKRSYWPKIFLVKSESSLHF